jgi:succinate dehydrogenase/fumarate reductase flavoprotein subunit
MVVGEWAPATIAGLHIPSDTMDQDAVTIFARRSPPGMHFLQKWPKIDPKG